MPTNAPLNRKLRMGLVGGGQGSFIGRVHCTAAVLDNRAALVAGALSSNADRAKASAPDYDIPLDRAYTSISELVQKEKALPADKRIDFVSVATPNHTPFDPARDMPGLLPDQISCHLTTFEPGRSLDDYGTAVIKFENGALGTVTASQISHGRENDLFIEIDGTKGALSWRQEEPNVMIVRTNGQPHRMFTRDPNASFINDAGKGACRLPSGHPEAFFEAFANVYRSSYDAMIQRAEG